LVVGVAVVVEAPPVRLVGRTAARHLCHGTRARLTGRPCRRLRACTAGGDK